MRPKDAAPKQLCPVGTVAVAGGWLACIDASGVKSALSGSFPATYSYADVSMCDMCRDLHFRCGAGGGGMRSVRGWGRGR